MKAHVLEHLAAVELEDAFRDRVGMRLHEVVAAEVLDPLDVLGIALGHHQFQLVMDVDGMFIHQSFAVELPEVIDVDAGEDVRVLLLEVRYELFHNHELVAGQVHDQVGRVRILDRAVLGVSARMECPVVFSVTGVFRLCLDGAGFMVNIPPLRMWSCR